jgi:Uma2 family endonuclease
MQATVSEPQIDQELEPQMHLWTIADYHQMIEAGILDEGDRVELLEGKIVCMSPQQPFHASSVQRSSNYLYETLKEKAYIRVQLPVTLGNKSEPEPDIAVVKLDANEYSLRHPASEDIYLLIEVADSTITKDRKHKSSIYAKNQVLEYWILDLQRRQVYIFRQPEAQSYREQLVLSSSDTASLQAFPDIAIALDALFPVIH